MSCGDLVIADERIKSRQKDMLYVLNCLLTHICPKNTTLVHSLRNSRIARFRER